VRTFRQFVEAKGITTGRKVHRINSVLSLARGIRDALKEFALPTRERAWDKMTSKKGQREINKLLKNPSRSLANFRTL